MADEPVNEATEYLRKMDAGEIDIHLPGELEKLSGEQLDDLAAEIVAREDAKKPKL